MQEIYMVTDLSYRQLVASIHSLTGLSVQMADDPVAVNMLLLKGRKEKLALATELDTLRRLNQEKDKQIQ